jgi:hypothetical protein
VKHDGMIMKGNLLIISKSRFHLMESDVIELKNACIAQLAQIKQNPSQFLSNPPGFIPDVSSLKLAPIATCFTYTEEVLQACKDRRVTLLQMDVDGTALICIYNAR